MVKLNKKEELEKFELFLFHIDEWMEEFQNDSKKQGYYLDMTMDSLKELARFIRENNINEDRDKIPDFVNCWIYLGEVFRLQAKGAMWTVGLDDPRNINYGQYYLTEYDEVGSEFIPAIYISNFYKSSEDRLDNNFLYGLIDKTLNPKPINLDYLPTED